MILLVIYIALGYWATGRTIYADKIVIYSGSTFICRRLAVGTFFGWILIPWAILKMIFGRH